MNSSDVLKIGPTRGTPALSGAADWTPASWQQRQALQQPTYDDAEELASASAHLAQLPPLVTSWEVLALKEAIAEAQDGARFLLQGGDCAETFADATADKISSRVRTILQMAVVLTYGASMPVIKMGRMAGQFAKPRSSNDETRDGVTLPAFRGDIVNGYDFTPESRAHDPKRMVQAYNTSSATLNLIRAFTQGGFADLRSVHSWNSGFMANPAHSAYEQLAGEIDSAIRFMDACGADFEALKRTEFFASHEALLLDYERALTRTDSRTGLPYDTSGHFLWIGERTRQLDHAHVDFLSRVRNPIGVKLGPTTDPEDVLALIDKLDPNREPGRLTFITRMGAKNIREKLPNLVEKVTASGAQVLWVTDPMHGNTVTSQNGYKTRNFEDVMDEVRGFFEVHDSLGTFPGGLHVEMTGDDVAECLGGADPIREEDFDSLYESLCDPRLNHRQSLEMAFLVSSALQSRSRNR
jgi:3-deoxy-7-phosphoheptulonate synthase